MTQESSREPDGLISRPVLDRWPGLLRRANAAKYCDMTIAKFERAVSNGELPLPVKINGEDRWFRHQIDARGQEAEDAGLHAWEKDSPLYAQG